MQIANCELCRTPGDEVVWADDLCRVVRVGGQEGADFPGFCRVVWRWHVAEMSDLSGAERRHFMNVVFATEFALRALVRPDKINLASLGNQLPHLHWHVIPRWRDDSRFPTPIWAPAQRPPSRRQPPPDNARLRDAIVQALAEEQAES